MALRSKFDSKKWSRHGYSNLAGGNSAYMQVREDIQRKQSKALKLALLSKTDSEYDLHYANYIYWSNKLNKL